MEPDLVQGIDPVLDKENRLELMLKNASGISKITYIFVRLLLILFYMCRGLINFR